MATDGRPSGGDVPPKLRLFCPACGHESPLDGDWLVRERAAGVAYECPECETEIADRTAIPT
jgi:predicted RNA-binding Zn-ribbon protein involved in translation (DUF1610 family)